MNTKFDSKFDPMWVFKDILMRIILDQLKK